MADASSLRYVNVGSRLPDPSGKNKGSIRWDNRDNLVRVSDGVDWMTPSIDTISCWQATPATQAIFVAPRKCRLVSACAAILTAGGTGYAVVLAKDPSGTTTLGGSGSNLVGSTTITSAASMVVAAGVPQTMHVLTGPIVTTAGASSTVYEKPVFQAQIGTVGAAAGKITGVQLMYEGLGGTNNTGNAFTFTVPGSGKLVGINVVSSGYYGNCAAAPTLSFSGGGGTGAAATVIMHNGKVVGAYMTNAGSGYTSAPTITVNRPTGFGLYAGNVDAVLQAVVPLGSSAAGTCTIASNKVTPQSIALSNNGTGYNYPEAVSTLWPGDRLVAVYSGTIGSAAGVAISAQVQYM